MSSNTFDKENQNDNDGELPDANRWTTVTKDQLKSIIDYGFKEGRISQETRNRLYQIIHSSDDPSVIAWELLQHNLNGIGGAGRSDMDA